MECGAPQPLFVDVIFNHNVGQSALLAAWAFLSPITSQVLGCPAAATT